MKGQATIKCTQNISAQTWPEDNNLIHAFDIDIPKNNFKILEI